MAREEEVEKKNPGCTKEEAVWGILQELCSGSRRVALRGERYIRADEHI